MTRFELADEIANVLARSGEGPDEAAVALAVVLGSVCREGSSDLDEALGVVRLVAAAEVGLGSRRQAA